MSFSEHEADVLVVGGGFGGCVAACVAAEKGVNVTMLMKGTLQSGGSARAGLQGGLNIFPRSEVKVYSSAGEARGTWKPQDLDRFWKSVEIQAEGLLNKEFTRYLIERSWEMLPKLESYGLKLTTKSLGDQYMWTITLGDMVQLSFDDWEVIQPKLGKHVRTFSNIEVFERMMAVDLVMDEGKVRGVIAFNIRTGDIHVFYGKTVILSTGSCSRLYESPSGIPYNTRYSPYNTGDGQAMVLRAGGELVNMEIVFWSMCPKDFEWAGTTWSTKMGAIWRNAKGERIMEKYHPDNKEGVHRHTTVRAIIEEIRQNNGPIFLDFTQVPEEKIKEVYDHISYPLKEYLKSRDINFSKAPVEYMPHGDCPLIGGITGGISVDMKFKTSLENVYAVGNCSNSGFTLNGASSHACVLGGMIAAEDAATQSKRLVIKKLDDKEKNRLINLIQEPLHKKIGMRPEVPENNLRKIMSSYVGYGRNEKGLSIAIERIKSLRGLLDEVKVDDPRGLMKFFDLRNLLDLGEGIAKSALFRRESRFIPCHYRSDYPEKNDQEWYGKRVAVRLENNELKLYKIPTL